MTKKPFITQDADGLRVNLDAHEMLNFIEGKIERLIEPCLLARRVISPEKFIALTRHDIIEIYAQMLEKLRPVALASAVPEETFNSELERLRKEAGEFFDINFMDENAHLRMIVEKTNEILRRAHGDIRAENLDGLLVEP